MANAIGHITQVIGAVIDVQFEGDLPAMAERKRSRLASAGLARPTHHVVGLDILADEGPLSLGEATRGLFDHSKGIAIITEGLLTYFDGATVARFWRHLADFASPFAADVYLSDIHLSGRVDVGAIKVFRQMLSVFARGRTHLHFARESEVAPALAQAGFARAVVHHPRELAKTLPLPGIGGLEVVQVLEASTR